MSNDSIIHWLLFVIKTLDQRIVRLLLDHSIIESLDYFCGTKKKPNNDIFWQNWDNHTNLIRL